MSFLRISVLLFFVGFFILTGCQRPKKSYWENGQLQSELNYKDGKLDGKATWYYKNGLREQEVNYTANKLNGKLTRWYANGNLETESFYKKGILDGISISYNEQGKKVTEEIFTNDTLNGPYLVLHDNGAPKIEGAYKMGSFIGRWVYYSPSGQIIGVGNFENGSGTQKAWWPNGNLMREVNYRNNLKHGEERLFNEKGELEKVIHNKEGQKQSEK